MDQSIIDSVRRQKGKTPTADLIALYKERSGRKSEEFFEAIRQLLVARGVDASSLDLRSEAKKQISGTIRPMLNAERADLLRLTCDLCDKVMCPEWRPAFWPFRKSAYLPEENWAYNPNVPNSGSRPPRSPWVCPKCKHNLSSYIDARHINATPAKPSLTEQLKMLGLATTQITYVAPALVVLNVLIFGLMVSKNVPITDPSPASLIGWGAAFGPKTTNGQWWRLLTAMFVHAGITHLLFNMFVLADIGVFMESLLGNVAFLALYLVAGVGGSLASLWLHPYVVSVGASGGIFGLYGGLLGFLLWSRGSMPVQILKPLLRTALIFVVGNMLFGLGVNRLGVKSIDVAAHLGGFGTGFLLGLFVARHRT